MANKRTVATPVILEGIGTHSGAACRVEVRPAVDGISVNAVPLSVEAASAESGFTSVAGLGTIEHLLASLNMLGIDAAEIAGVGEMPILDGSAAPIVAKLREAGIVETPSPRQRLRVLREVVFENESGRVSLSPIDGNELSFDVAISYPGVAAIGDMSAKTSFAEMDKIAEARSFARVSDIEKWHAAGRALGASLATGIGLSDAGEVMNPEGLRSPLEFVYHKALDAAGDLYTCGFPIVGAYKSFKGGHAHNNALVKTLMSDPLNYRIEDV